MTPREKAKELVTHSTMEANEVYNIIDRIYNDHEAHLKAKDDEIKRLKAERDHFHDKYISVGWLIGDWIKETKTARSIVAMLFWEWRKAEKLYQDEWNIDNKRMSLALFAIQSSTSEQLFKQAYKILKDNQ